VQRVPDLAARDHREAWYGGGLVASHITIVRAADEVRIRTG